MPPKKSHPKKPTSHKKKSSMAKPMPSLIFSEGTIQKPAEQAVVITPPTEPAAIEPILNFSQPDTAARRWMWVGVVSLSVIIFIFWSWSFYMRISTAQLKRAPEFTLAHKTTEDWNAIFAQRENDRANKEFAATKLREIITALANATSTTSSVATTTTTSTIATSTAPSTTTPTFPNTLTH